MNPIRYRTPINHKNIIFKSYLPILFKRFFLRPGMVFNREKLFYCFKNIWQKSGKLSGHIFPICKSFNTWSCSKYWTKPPKIIYSHFKDLKYFYRKYFHKNPRKFHHVTNTLFGDLAKSHVMENSITPWNPLKTTSFLFQVWTTLHYQTCPNVLKSCEHAQMV